MWTVACMSAPRSEQKTITCHPHQSLPQATVGSTWSARALIRLSAPVNRELSLMQTFLSLLGPTMASIPTHSPDPLPRPTPTPLLPPPLPLVVFAVSILFWRLLSLRRNETQSSAFFMGVAGSAIAEDRARTYTSYVSAMKKGNSSITIRTT